MEKHWILLSIYTKQPEMVELVIQYEESGRGSEIPCCPELENGNIQMMKCRECPDWIIDDFRYAYCNQCKDHK